MKQKLFRATLLFLLASCITAGSGFLVPAHALPSRASITIFYSDATHRTEVGFIEVTCTQIIFRGRETQFSTFQDLGAC